MTWWAWLLAAFAAGLVLYLLVVVGLIAAGRREAARAMARLVPDCAVLFGRLARDPRIPRRRRLLIAAMMGYLASPLDLVPDFIPVVGQLDDAILVGLVLRAVLRGAGPELVTEHWPGPPSSLALILRVAKERSEPGP